MKNLYSEIFGMEQRMVAFMVVCFQDLNGLILYKKILNTINIKFSRKRGDVFTFRKNFQYYKTHFLVKKFAEKEEAVHFMILNALIQKLVYVHLYFLHVHLKQIYKIQFATM